MGWVCRVFWEEKQWISNRIAWVDLFESGFSGLVDFQDWGLVYRMFFAMKKLLFLIGRNCLNQDFQDW